MSCCGIVAASLCAADRTNEATRLARFKGGTLCQLRWSRVCILSIEKENMDDSAVIIEEPNEHHPPRLGALGWRSLVQVTLGLALLFSIVTFAGHYFRADLERVGEWFVETTGYAGMGFGTFLADGLHFPVPPQFYMLMVVIGGSSALLALGAISLGSIAGGHVAYYLALKVRNVAFIKKRAERVSGTMSGLLDRFGAWAMVLGSLMPVPYSFLCYLSGLNRLPYRLFALLCLLRIPKIVAYFYLIRAGWSLGPG